MLQTVDLEPQPLEPYEAVIGSDRLDALRDLAADLAGIRIVHINATLYGGGVSELLRSVVALERALGIDARWQVVHGDDRFFAATKGLHNALQGGPYRVERDARDRYLEINRQSAAALERDHDVVVVHDPQPLGLRRFHEGGSSAWVWRCHIDTSDPNPEALAFVTPFVEEYDALVFTMSEFIPGAWRDFPVAVIQPAIDPLSPKNMDLPEEVEARIIRWLGVDPRRPIVTQVSRFDRWKDPTGVVDVYRSVREEVPDLQLALLGSMALDDPEGWDLYQRIRSEVAGDLDIHVATNLTGVSNIEVNAFQRRSDVVIQKSIREGFGLVVSETLWKGTPMVAGRAGGIPIQMPDGVGGFLVDDRDGFAEPVLTLLRDRALAGELGERGRGHVTDRFLVNRLIADELALVRRLRSGEYPGP